MIAFTNAQDFDAANIKLSRASVAVDGDGIDDLVICGSSDCHRNRLAEGQS